MSDPGTGVGDSAPYWGRLIRFTIVGALTGTVFAVFVAIFVDVFGLRESTAAGLAYVLLLLPNFLAHKRTVFRSRRPALPEWLRYLFMHCVTAGISMAIMTLATGTLLLSHWIGSIAVIAAAPVINLILMEFWVFPQGNSKQA